MRSLPNAGRSLSSWYETRLMGGASETDQSAHAAGVGCLSTGGAAQESGGISVPRIIGHLRNLQSGRKVL